MWYYIQLPTRLRSPLNLVWSKVLLKYYHAYICLRYINGTALVFTVLRQSRIILPRVRTSCALSGVGYTTEGAGCFLFVDQVFSKILEERESESLGIFHARVMCTFSWEHKIICSLLYRWKRVRKIKFRLLVTVTFYSISCDLYIKTYNDDDIRSLSAEWYSKLCCVQQR